MRTLMEVREDMARIKEEGPSDENIILGVKILGELYEIREAESLEEIRKGFESGLITGFVFGVASVSLAWIVGSWKR